MSIFTAIKDNNLDRVRDLAPLHWNERFGDTTPLCYACKFFRTECIEILAPYGNLDQINENKHTPLSHMVWYLKPIQVEFLLKLGADPNIGNSLWTAVSNQDVHIVTLLLEYGANPNKIQFNIAPLDIAIKDKNLPLIELLLQHHATIYHRSALFNIIDDIYIINLLLQHNFQFSHEELHHAIRTHNNTVVSILLDHDVSLRDGHLNMHVACQSNNIDVVRLLLTRQINVNEVDCEGESPLFVTTSKKIIKLLLNKGVDINLKNNGGDTYLHQAVQIKDFKLTKLLLSLGADPLITNTRGLPVKDMVDYWASEVWSDDDDGDYDDNKQDLVTKFKDLIAQYEMDLIKEPDQS